MRLVCISDTHSMHRQVSVPDGDVLIHAGDCLGVGTLEELEDLDNWFSEQPHRHKILIAGSPWTPIFFDWAFNLERGTAIAERWAQIPSDTDVLITHGPPAGILDQVNESLAVGCGDLAWELERLTLKLHIFGHIHESYGQQTLNDCRYINASTCTGQYKPLNPPIVVDI